MANNFGIPSRNMIQKFVDFDVLWTYLLSQPTDRQTLFIVCNMLLLEYVAGANSCSQYKLTTKKE